MLTVTVENLNDGVVLHCEGRIVRGYETALLCAASRYYGRSVIVDLEHVEAIDAAGIGALIALQASGTYVQLKNPSPRVREVLRVTNVDSILEIGGLPPGHEVPAQAVA